MTETRSLRRVMFPVLSALAVVFLVTGASLATLPLYVHAQLGYSASVVGAIAGAQFASALISRLWAGRHSDRHGPKAAMVVGLVMAMLAGLAYLTSVALQARPDLALAALFVGRALLGGGESFIITSGQAWGLALAGQNRAAMVIGWAGTALYVALAAGGPMGGWLFSVAGFAGVAAATALIPLLALAIILPRPKIIPARHTNADRGSVLKAVLAPGLAMSFAGFGYSSMAFFSVLLFLQRGWQPSWLPFSAFAVALVLTRLGFAGLPDRLGGKRTTITFLGVQIIGLTGVMLAPSAGLCALASFVAGLGYAFIYPALGREAVVAVSPARAGVAVAFYSAFLDLSLGLSSPLLGQIADIAGVPAVFAASVLASAVGLAIVIAMTRTHRRSA